MKKRIIVTTVIALSIILILFFLKGIIPKQIYRSKVNKLAGKVSVNEPIDYRDDLRYTMDKFWSFHEQGIISRNDLNDVMDRLKALNQKETVGEDEIFDFIDYVSNAYTKASIQHNYEMLKSKNSVN